LDASDFFRNIVGIWTLKWIRSINSQLICSYIYSTYFFPQRWNGICEPVRKSNSVSNKVESTPCWHISEMLHTLWHVSMSKDNVLPILEGWISEIHSYEANILHWEFWIYHRQNGNGQWSRQFYLFPHFPNNTVSLLAYKIMH
jgi:hypothetical protein